MRIILAIDDQQNNLIAREEIVKNNVANCRGVESLSEKKTELRLPENNNNNNNTP